MSVYVNNTNNQVGVNPTYNTVNVIPDGTTFIVEVITPGPQGPQGEPGNPDLFTSSFVTTSSFYAFTASYTTASFTGSFTGNGSGLTGVISSSYALTASYVANVDINTSSFATTGSNRFIGNQIITGSLNVTQGITGSLFGTATTASYFLTSSVTSASYAETSSYADNFTVANVLTVQTVNAQIISSSAIYSSGSNVFGNNLNDTQIFTGSVKITGSLNINGIDYTSTSASFNTRINANSSSIGILSSSYLASSASFNTRINSSNTGSFNGAFTGSFSGSLWNLQNDVIGHIPYFISSQVLKDSSIIQIDNGYSVAINQNGITTAAPEALYVWQPSTSSYNVISGKGNLNSYLQLNIQNVNEGDTASSDVVASVANSTETLNYVDMGINGPGFTEKPGYSVGGANDTYLLSVANNHYMGSATSGKVTIFTGPDFNGEEHAKIVLQANNQHELTGSFKVDGSITGSLFGTASNATSASYAQVATSASYAVTSSYANDFIVAGTLTAQTINVQTVSSSVIYSSGSNIFGNNLSNTQKFTGSVQITGSLTVNNSAAILTNQTSSMTVLSSSYALTASYASNVPLTASFAISSSQAQNAVSSSYALTASYASNVPVTASYAINAATASYVNPLIQNLILTGSLLVSGSANFNNAVAINDANVNLTNSSSLNLTSGSGIYVNEPGVISGSIVGIGNVASFSGSVNSRLTALETLIDGGTY